MPPEDEVRKTHRKGDDATAPAGADCLLPHGGKQSRETPGAQGLESETGLLEGGRLRTLWSRPSGYLEVLAMALPLAMSTAAWSVQHVVDRAFLAWYSPVALAAAFPAGLLSFTLVSFFMGTASYVNTFVAQYTGANRPERVGPAVWQAMYFSVLSGVAIAACAPIAGPLFRWAGHTAEMREFEEVYFSILCLGGGFAVYSSALSGFFSGLGRTWTVMWVNILATLVNLVLDYALIFGHWGFPRWGVRGAAWATVAGAVLSAVLFTALFLSRHNRQKYATWTGRTPDGTVFRRLMRYGLPSGLHFTMDISAFALFMVFVGRLGVDAMAASTVAIQVNTLAFLPMIGFGIATSVLVGQRLGENRPDLAARATWSAFHITFGYMVVMSLSFVLIPRVYLSFFAAKADPAQFRAIEDAAVIILRFVAFFSVFDAMNIIFASGLKGAGDTRFVMWVSVTLAWVLMVVPSWFACRPGGGGMYVAWAWLTAYVALLGFGFLGRFLGGKWRSMRVIEMEALPSGMPLPESPTVDVDL